MSSLVVSCCVRIGTVRYFPPAPRSPTVDAPSRMRAADGRKLYEEQQVWAAHRSKQGARLRGKEQRPLTADELAIVQRARGTHLGERHPLGERHAGQRPATAADARVKRTASNKAHSSSMQAARASGVPYPQADVRTLQMLGTIDALLKAPPRPPRWALLRILSLLEEFRERSQHGGEGFAPPAQQRSLSEAVRQHGARGRYDSRGRLDSRGRFEASRGEGNESAARAVARRVREQMQGPPDDEPRAHRSWDILAPDRDLGTRSGHRRVYEDRDVRGRNRVSMGIG